MKLFQAAGPGGNEKTGLYHYGSEMPALIVKKSANDDTTCLMENDKVSVMNLNHQTETVDSFQPYSFTCFENDFKEINGAYSPINDAFFFGQVVYDMYQAYLGVSPVGDSKLIKLAVHYGNNYKGALWNGRYAAFGDGDGDFYPIVSLDEVAHEISHGFSEHYSNPSGTGQRSAINEAFSDMAGEAAEYYLKGGCDFRFGSDIVKSANGAKRYLDDPPMDGSSIDNAKDYYEGMNFYKAAGVYNKAFYLLSQRDGWDPKHAFKVFAKANMQYWNSETDFTSGAHDVYYTAKKSGYEAKDVKDVFFDVGILVKGDEAYANFSYQISFLNVAFTDLSASPQGNIVRWHWEFGDGEESFIPNPVHGYYNTGVFPKIFEVRLTIEDQAGAQAYWTENVMVDNDYCDVASNNANEEWISDVSIGSTSFGSAESNYSDFTGKIFQVKTGDTYTVSLTAEYCIDCVERNETWGVWADLNIDGDFSDDGEFLLTVSGKGTVEQQVTFSNPNTITSTRLRIAMSGGATLNSCGKFSWGEVEDYTIEFIP